MTLDELIAWLEDIRRSGTPGSTTVLLARAWGYEYEIEYREIGSDDLAINEMRIDNHEWKFVGPKIKGEDVLVISSQ